ncbi:sulfite reductase [Candidatus Nitromaritima sp. SCGC AAA799-C22]|nr:sulfite reductase [Candidatus Nitromaritima sp. SCGC AAA799-C22]
MDTRTLNIPPEVKREIEEFTAEVERLNRGEVDPEDFKRYRLQQGIYGQRQDDVQMVRTKLPQGRMTSDQLLCLADFADKYSNKILHVTTRQDIQFHFVKLEDVPQGLQDLADHGLTTREACGNTVRNVTACHKAGTCKNEAFDVAPYGLAITNFLLRHSLTQNLPRKFKISLGGCGGCGLAPIHDIGLKAVIKNENGKDARGFKVLIGGGLGSFPHGAKPLTDFISSDNLLRMCEAIVQVFDKYGDKKNRNKARFKYVLDKLGLEKIKELYEEEYAALKGKEFPAIEVPEETLPSIPRVQASNGFDSDPGFQAWKNRNTCEQKQNGFLNVQIKLLLGDLTSDKARSLAKIASDYAGSIVINTVNQNMMVPWVKEEALGAVYGEFRKIELHKAGTEEIRDITCCPGSETCNLGITASRGLVKHLSGEMENGFPHSSELDHISIKASGCPNSCGQHHIASIGFHGGAKKINGVLTPHYEVLLGGRIDEDNVVFGTSVIKIPSKNAPKASRQIIEAYKNGKQNDETFSEFYDRKGKDFFRELLDPLRDLPDIEADPQAYIDFGTDKKFSLEDRGQGECAGAVTDMIQDHLAEAERAHFQSKLSLEKDALTETVEHARRSTVASARALLVTEGMDFNDDLECIRKFHSLIIDMEIVSAKFAEMGERFEEDASSADRSMAEWWVENCGELAQECRRVNDKMQTDKSLRIRVGGDTKDAPEKSTDALQKIDLLGVKCPFNYVKTKLKLETMASGDTLEVLLDLGEPEKNVPRSIQNDGHKILSMNKDNGHFKIVIEKA